MDGSFFCEIIRNFRGFMGKLYDELSKDYWKLTEQHYKMKASYELQIESLKTENRQLQDKSLGLSLWAIITTVLLVASAFLYGFFGR